MKIKSDFENLPFSNFSIFFKKNSKKNFSKFFRKNFRIFFERYLWFGLLKTSFKDFEFVFGAKVIYFSHWIQIWRNFWRARTSARAAEWKNSLHLEQKMNLNNVILTYWYFQQLHFYSKQLFYVLKFEILEKYLYRFEIVD